MTFWDEVVAVVDHLYEALGLRLPRPQPKASAVDGDSAGGGVYEDGSADRSRGIDDVFRSLYVDSGRER